MSEKIRPPESKIMVLGFDINNCDLKLTVAFSFQLKALILTTLTTSGGKSCYRMIAKLSHIIFLKLV